MIETMTLRKETLIIKNINRACFDIEKLNNTGYSFINLASGFIAHYNLDGFKSFYDRGQESLKYDIIKFKPQNQWENFFPGQENYNYYMQKKKIYNSICSGIEVLTKEI